jgi:hypothetical protein
MTARQLIDSIQKLGEENLDREVIMADAGSFYTPYKVEILFDEEWKRQQGKILID